MAKSKKGRNVDDLGARERADMIRRLEKEREKINNEIESLLKTYARESGNRALRKRRASIGGLPNDYSFEEDA